MNQLKPESKITILLTVYRFLLKPRQLFRSLTIATDPSALWFERLFSSNSEIGCNK